MPQTPMTMRMILSCLDFSAALFLAVGVLWVIESERLYSEECWTRVGWNLFSVTEPTVSGFANQGVSTILPWTNPVANKVQKSNSMQENLSNGVMVMLVAFVGGLWFW
jgi:hypothetical protein